MGILSLRYCVQLEFWFARRETKDARRGPSRSHLRLTSHVSPLTSYGLSKPSRDVVLRDLLARVREDFLGAVVLDQPSQHEEGRRLRDPRGLLHVVGHDDDRV